MSQRNRFAPRRYEDPLERRANKAYKVQQQESAERQYNSRRLYDMINSDEDDFDDHDEWDDESESN
jgi:hypothetical protein